jgi:hypothetical protein
LDVVVFDVFPSLLADDIIKNLNDYDVIGSGCVWFGDRPGVVPQIPLGDISSHDFSLVNTIIISSSVIIKELCELIATGIQVYDLWLRLRKQGKKFFNLKERHQSTTWTSSNQKSLKWNGKAWRRR